MKRTKEVGKELDSSKNFQKLIHLNALECDDVTITIESKFVLRNEKKKKILRQFCFKGREGG